MLCGVVGSTAAILLVTQGDELDVLQGLLLLTVAMGCMVALLLLLLSFLNARVAAKAGNAPPVEEALRGEESPKEKAIDTFQAAGGIAVSTLGIGLMIFVTDDINNKLFTVLAVGGFVFGIGFTAVIVAQGMLHLRASRKPDTRTNGHSS